VLPHWAQCLFDTACRIDGVRTVLGGRVLPRAWVRHADAGGTSASLLPTQKLVELIQCRHSDGKTHIGLTSSKAGPALSTYSYVATCEPTIGQYEYPFQIQTSATLFQGTPQYRIGGLVGEPTCLQ